MINNIQFTFIFCGEDRWTARYLSIILSRVFHTTTGLCSSSARWPRCGVSYSQKKRAMLPGFYSFRALGIPMIEDFSCCCLQEISGNNVVILFQRYVQYCYPRNWLNSARTLLNIQQLALLGSKKTSFLPNIFGICCWPTIILLLPKIVGMGFLLSMYLYK